MHLKRNSILYLLGLVFFSVSVLVPYVEGSKCSSENFYVSLSKKESHCFDLPSADTKSTDPEEPPRQEELQVTFLGIESHYYVPQMYTFFPPNMSVICECACDDDTTTSCTEDTYYKHEKCARHKSEQSVCSLYYKQGTDPRICSTTYKLCCQVYFSIPNTNGSKYYGLYLNKHENNIQLSLSLNVTANGKIKESQVFYVPKHVRRIQFNNDTMLTISMVSPNEALPDDWYFVQDGTHQLMTGVNLNKIGEQDFRKLGWFQMARFGPEKKEELLAIDSHLIENFLRIQPLKCQASNPRYEWDFPAKYYSKVGAPSFPIIGKLATQIHGMFISNISIDMDKQTVVVDHRNPPELRIMVSKSQDILNDLIFNASIYHEKSFNMLKLNFTHGKRITYLVNVAYGEREHSEDFYVTIYKSQSFPAEFSIKLSERINSPTWVCLYEQADTQKQLCRLAQVFINSSSTDDDPQADTLSGANNYVLKEVYHEDGWLKSLAIIALFLAIVSIVAQLIFYFLFYKKSKQRNAMNRSPSTEHIKQDFAKEDKTDAEGNRYSHLYEFLKPTHAVKPLDNNETGMNSV